MMTSDPTTTDAVTMLQRLYARTVHSENRGDVPRVSSDEVLAVLQAIQAERARHVEEVAEERAWGEAKFAGAQYEIAHLRAKL